MGPRGPDVDRIGSRGRRRIIEPFDPWRIAAESPEDDTDDDRAADRAAQIAAKMVIGGQQVDAADGQTFEVLDPATGQVMATAPLGGKEDVDRAVEAAQAAFDDRKGWSSWSASKRGRTLAKFSALVKANLEELARLESRNVGKPITGARGEALGASLVFEYYAGAANKVFGETIPVSKPGLDFTLREPIGVVGLIVPWNFPMLMASWKLGPALAAGNTCILKPASWTPLTAIRLGELALEAGFPPGVVNVVTGPGGTAGAAIAGHPGIGKVAFTGETTTGQEIMRLAATNVKKVSLELGGKSPNIVFADADLERSPASRPTPVFDNCGQDCCARSRILVERSVHDQVVELFVEATRKVMVGRSGRRRDRGRAAGPSAPARAGARLHRDRPGRRAPSCSSADRAPDDAALAAGTYVLPTVFDGVSQRHADRARGDLRAGRVDHPVRHGGGGRPAGQRHAVRPVGLDLEPGHRPGAADREGGPGGRPQRELEQLGPHRGPVRRLQDVRHRPRARDARGRAVHRDQERLRRPHLTDRPSGPGRRGHRRRTSGGPDSPMDLPIRPDLAADRTLDVPDDDGPNGDESTPAEPSATVPPAARRRRARPPAVTRSR